MIHVLYHNNCADGFLARVIAQRKLGFAVKFHAVQYKEPVPAAVRGFPDNEIYILDFSYPRHEMEYLAKHARKLVCLDHHATAQKELEGLDFCTFDMNKSGAMLAWEHFNPGVPAPLIVRYVQDRDLGKPWSDPEHSMGGSLDVHAGLFRATPRTYEAWSAVLDNQSLTPLMSIGSAITSRDEHLCREIARNPLWLDIAGHRVPAAQISHEYISDACNAMLVAHPDAPFACAWFVSSSNGQVTYSLRSRAPVMEKGENGQLVCVKPSFDVSALAKSLGGGGHPQAAGFSSDEAPQFV